MSRHLTSQSSLDSLRKEAKRWLRAIRAKDERARARLLRIYPQAPNEIGLRDVQHALALEHGLTNWIALRNALVVPSDHDRTDRAAAFLLHACPDWRVGGSQRHAMAQHAAMRALHNHPDIASANMYAAVVCGDVEAAERYMTEMPNAGSERGGPRQWEPLLYVCAARIPLATTNDNAVTLARALLDRGANPNAYYQGGDPAIHYTALTTLVGEGEEDAPRHPQHQALVELLLQRGAEPYDVQLFYNTHFRGDILWLLQLVHEHSVRRGRLQDWSDPEWSMIDMGGYGKGARFILAGAVKRNDLALVDWCLTHGASPEPAPAPHSSQQTRRSLYEEASVRGFAEIAQLLARFGATMSVPRLAPEEEFVAACLRLDHSAVRAAVAAHPEYLQSHVAMFAAVQRDRLDVVKLLLELGVSPEIEDRTKQRPLHVAVSHDALHVGAFLLEHGVQVDHREANWGATPLAWAVYGLKWRMIDLLTPYTRDVWNLTYAGKIVRLKDLFSVAPDLAKAAHPNGTTPLMRLPDDEAVATEIVELFLAHGADPTSRDDAGKTAADIATERGLGDAAEVLRTAEQGSDRVAPSSRPTDDSSP